MFQETTASKKLPTTSAADVVAAARAWIGTPFRRGMGVRGVGANCGLFVVGVMRDAGYLPDGVVFEGDAGNPEAAGMRAVCDQWLDRVPLADAAPGDVALIRIGRAPIHAGVLADGGSCPDGLSLIHSDVEMRGVAEVTLGDDLRRSVMQVYRLRSSGGIA